MANIDILLQEIMDAVYGEEVRGSIHDALAAMNQESSSAMEYAATAQDSAQRSASTATDKAAEASGYATTATTKAGEASASAQSAAGSASTAINKAAEASGYATTATTKAGEASASAQSAAESATTATFYSGKPPKPQNGTWWIWDVDVNPPRYIDTGISCELEGPQGVGIDNIQHTSGTHAPGTSDVYTIFLSDGSTYTISVWNGRNGEGSGDIIGLDFDLSIPVSGWNNGVATIADNRLIAQSKYKYFLIAVETSREEFIDCKVLVGDISTNGFITFRCETTPTHNLTVNITRIELAGNS